MLSKLYCTTTTTTVLRITSHLYFHLIYIDDLSGADVSIHLNVFNIKGARNKAFFFSHTCIDLE